MTAAQAYDPRANQKQRTRGAIVDAAIALLRSGVRPTVPEAAEAAKVSRATAYRYFPTQESLLVEAAVVAPVESIERMLETRAAADPEARLLEVVDRFNAIVIEEEAAMRTALHAYLDAWFAAGARGEAAPLVREGRRTRWIETALEQRLEGLGKQERTRLKAALALTLGVEGMVVMKDVCRLGDDEARTVLRWTAEAILRAALPKGTK